MNFIDLRTLILNQTIIYAACTLVVALLWQYNRKRFPGLSFWLVDFSLITIASLLLNLRGSVPPWISIVLGGNALMLGGTILLYIGLERFVGVRTKQAHNLVLFVVSAALHAYFAFVQPNLAARNINFSVGLLLISVQITWLMLRRVGPEMRSMTKLTGYVFVFYSLVSVGRIIVNLVIPTGNDFFATTVSLDIFLLFIYQILLFGVTFSLFLMINQRLFLELQTQQTALQKSEARYRQLFEFSPDAVVVHQEGQILFVNPAGLSMIGATGPSDLLGKIITDFIHPDHRSLAQQRISDVLAHGKTAPLIEEVFVRLDGTFVDVEVTTAPLEYQDQPALQSIIREITERKRAEGVLRLRLGLFEFAADHSLEELMRRALDEIGEITNSPIGFYHFVEADQKKLSLQAWSTRTLQEFCQAEGTGMHYSLDQAGVWVDCVRERKPVIHNDYATLPHRKGLPPGHAEVKRELVVPTLRNRQIVSILGVGNKPSDYDERDVDLVRYVADVIWSIVERKRAETQLQVYQHQLETQNLELQKLSLAIEQSGNTIIITDPNGKIQYANPRFEQTSGFTLNDAQGENPRILKSGQQDTDFYQDLWQTISRGQTWRGEFQNKHKNGSLYWESATVAPVQNDAGEITNYIAIKEKISERKRMEADLERLATTDSLTGALNRRQLAKVATHELERSHRYGHPTSIILLDIDYFKEINDRYGHAVGDRAIQQTAETLSEQLRQIDYLGRYGGDEFVIVLPETNQTQAEQAAERLRTTINQQNISNDDQNIRLSITLGLVCVTGGNNETGLGFDALTQLADRALYAAKEAGRNCIRVYDNGCKKMGGTLKM